jgi:dTDP-4-dehydrorhamnose 3,5-epimerase-like enzyme
MTHKIIVKNKFSDNRGEIISLIEDFANVQIIYSKKGSMRANHYHKTDSHYCYLITGSIEYIWRDHSDNVFNKELISSGELFLTGPNIDHEMIFIEDSIMVVISEYKRDSVSYENDIVRIKPLHENI